MTSSNIYIVSAPSGTGKTSLNSKLVKEVPQVEVSVSLTSRPKRSNEIEGVSYRFVTKEEFLDHVNKGDMLEYAEVFGHYYGTSKRDVNRILSNGKKVILEIDVQGCRNIKTQIPSACSIFVLPPSVQTIWKRLEARGTDSFDARRKRFLSARQEILNASFYDYYIVNESFDNAFFALRSLVVDGKAPSISRSAALAHCQELLNEYDSFVKQIEQAAAREA